MTVIKPPQQVQDTFETTVFLAGSIEQNNAEQWQDRLVALMPDDSNICFLNPRRDSWDATWIQDVNNPVFRQQVDWELDGIGASDLVVFYFDPNTKSPITLLELGIVASTRPGQVCVCCHIGYWRKGNVDIVCQRFGIDQVDKLGDLAKWIRLRS